MGVTIHTSRAVHIEVIEELSSSSFINALRRFMAIRGPVKLFRSDRGTNFIGSTDDLHIDAINVESSKVKEFLFNSGTKWIFNAPHSSHMGGVWERMIGITRKILDAMMLEHGSRALTQEVLSTFMLEVCAIVTSRPIANISSDPSDPIVLNPGMLLTQKTCPQFLKTLISKMCTKHAGSMFKCCRIPFGRGGVILTCSRCNSVRSGTARDET